MVGIGLFGYKNNRELLKGETNKFTKYGVLL